jgi:hypothetical protein
VRVRLIERSLDRIGDAVWERVGVGMGLVACASIGSQLAHELASRAPSTLSGWFLGGFALGYGFWFFYGLRFRRLAIWLPNGIAVALQLALALAVAAKAR